jgi:hypothetical protein
MMTSAPLRILEEILELTKPMASPPAKKVNPRVAIPIIKQVMQMERMRRLAKRRGLQARKEAIVRSEMDEPDMVEDEEEEMVAEIEEDADKALISAVTTMLITFLHRLDCALERVVYSAFEEYGYVEEEENEQEEENEDAVIRAYMNRIVLPKGKKNKRNCAKGRSGVSKRKNMDAATPPAKRKKTAVAVTPGVTADQLSATTATVSASAGPGAPDSTTTSAASPLPSLPNPPISQLPPQSSPGDLLADFAMENADDIVG